MSKPVSTPTQGLVASKIYKELEPKREPYLRRAREAALLTIPQLFPPEGSSSDTNYPTPYQSLGAKGVNNLANKIILSLFPPQTAFFKMGLSPADMAATGKGEGELQTAMYVLESSIVNEMEISSLRPKQVHLIKNLIVGGSAVIYIPNVGQPELFSLNEFVVKRDKQGNVLRLVIKQSVAYASLAKKIQAQIPKEHISEDVINGKEMLDLYTCTIKVSDNKYELFQELCGRRIEGTQGTYKADDLPYRFIPFVDTGEDYGRSYIEDFIGDLQSYEGLRQSILECAAESARIIYLLKPNSTLSIKKLQNARSGDVLTGDIADVATLQSDKRLDMSVTQKEADNLKGDLAITFLLDSAVRRDAERVTAAEIRQVSQELEVALGGIYSTLANILQAPLVRLYMNRLISQKKINSVLKDAVKLEITTGSAALGRGSDFQVLNTFVGAIGQIMQNPAAGQYIQLSELMQRLAYSLDINTASLIVTEEERQAAQQAQQEAQLAEKSAPALIKAAADQQGQSQQE